MTAFLDMAPFVPREDSMLRHGLLDLASTLNREAAKLTGRLADETAETIRQHMAVINSYYSNLIEGNRTLPHQIREAQRGDFSQDPVARDHQLESVAHIDVQDWIQDEKPDLARVCSPEFLLELHQRFYQDLPETLRIMKLEDGGESFVEPGAFRRQLVTVGRHQPPAAEDISQLVGQTCDHYAGQFYPGDKRFVALACAHHRLLWIHPFLDGNGRVIRLWTDAAWAAAGLESVGVWCLSRGLAKQSEAYKSKLARADFPRQGNHDGRGYLSETELALFCKFMLETALDQVDYISKLLDLGGMQKRIRSYVQARNDSRIHGFDGGLKPEASQILFQAFIQGNLERSTALEMTGSKEDRTARRLIKQLKDDGLLSETSSRSPLKWEIPEHAEPFYFPQLAPGI
ncbi:Fic family protein [Marinobacter sp.]|uniref:Fic family protein n=1 Tax=Marinobacter sp. TaxID=50741 RepID=UPI003A955500